MAEKEEKDGAKDWDILETHLLRHRPGNAEGRSESEGEGQSEEMLNEYRVLRILGKGSFGIVKKCQREVKEPPYREFALKVTPLPLSCLLGWSDRGLWRG